MPKKPLVNQPTEKSVTDFIEAVKNKTRKSDAKILLQLFKEVTGKKPVMWGKSIIAYGRYNYQRKNGETHEWFNAGFSPGSKHMSIYLMYDINEEQDLLNKLGPHSTGRGCLYIKKIEDINTDILKQLISKSDRWETT